MKAQNLLSGEWEFFIDKCLPFGSSIRCALFQKFSNVLKHIVEHLVEMVGLITNYLDDFLFMQDTLEKCNALLECFLWVCSAINFPVSHDKTERVTLYMVLSGYLLNGVRHTLSIPEEKSKHAINLINLLMSKKKAKVLELQQLAGTLNFLCKAIHPGCVFLCRMYSIFSKIVDLPGLNGKK